MEGVHDKLIELFNRSEPRYFVLHKGKLEWYSTDDRRRLFGAMELDCIIGIFIDEVIWVRFINSILHSVKQ